MVLLKKIALITLGCNKNQVDSEFIAYKLGQSFLFTNNLKEAEIILAERNTHLRELKKERDQAIKFKELEGKIKQNKASYLWMQIERKEKQTEGLTKKVNE